MTIRQLTTLARDCFAPAIITLLLLFSSALPAQAQDKINFSEIEVKAALSQAAYLPEDKIKKLVDSSNYDLTFYATDTQVQVAFFIVTNDTRKTQTIVVRGTSNVENAFVNLSLKLKLDKKSGIRLHDGFSFAASKVYTALQPYLNRDYTISTTGHSLGGAAAVIVAAYLDKDGYKIGSVITFGQPKVTNIEGAEALKHLDIKRIVLPRDVVPLVPPFDPLDIQNIDIYWHAGRELILLEDSQYTIIGGVDSMLRATKFTQQALNEGNLENHEMAQYLQSVKSKLSGAKHITYENSFNLFNLFAAE